MKIVKNMVKYAMIAIFVGGLVAVVTYFQNGTVDILEILKRSG